MSHSFTLRRGCDGASDGPGRGRLRLVIILASVIGETAGIWLRAHRLGGNVVVRCQRGHLFTTLWIPAVSLKSLGLGWWRLQRCPVGGHWSVVTPVRESELTPDEQRFAAEHRDVRIP